VKRVEETEKVEEVRRRMEAAWDNLREGGVEGMRIDVDEGDNDDGEETEQLDPMRPPKRKTAQQRRKAARALAEVKGSFSCNTSCMLTDTQLSDAFQKRSRANLAQKRQQLASLTTLKSLRRAAENAQSEAQRAAAERAEKKLAKGLIGMRIGRFKVQFCSKPALINVVLLGKHIIQEGDVEVQLGEDLPESLRELKPEGNLWRDRWGSMVARGKVEPRVPVL
jgi:nucleolar protein 53